MLLIEKAWARVYPQVMLETGELVSHDIKRLRNKDNWGTQAPKTGVPSSATAMETEEETGVDDDDDDDDYMPSEAEPSWAKKLKSKMKKLFCMEAHG